MVFVSMPAERNSRDLLVAQNSSTGSAFSICHYWLNDCWPDRGSQDKSQPHNALICFIGNHGSSPHGRLLRSQSMATKNDKRTIRMHSFLHSDSRVGFVRQSSVQRVQHGLGRDGNLVDRRTDSICHCVGNGRCHWHNRRLGGTFSTIRPGSFSMFH